MRSTSVAGSQSNDAKKCAVTLAPCAAQYVDTDPIKVVPLLRGSNNGMHVPVACPCT